VTMGLKRWLYIGNTKLRGSDPDVRNIDYAGMTAECRIDRCGDPGGKVAIVERQQTASEPPDKPAPMEGMSKTELVKTKVPNDQLPN